MPDLPVSLPVSEDSPDCKPHPSRCLCPLIHRPAPPVSLPVSVDSPAGLPHPSRCLCLWIHHPACTTRLVACVCGFTALPVPPVSFSVSVDSPACPPLNLNSRWSASIPASQIQNVPISDDDDDDDRLFMACPVSKEPRALTKADEYALDRDREE